MGDNWFDSHRNWEAKSAASTLCERPHSEELTELESAFYAEAILRMLPAGAQTLVDFGCGVGRAAKAILERNDDVRIVGVEESEFQRGLAEDYVDNDRFRAIGPDDDWGTADLAYSVTDFGSDSQSMLGGTLRRLHRGLKPGGALVACISNAASGASSPADVDHDLFVPVGAIFDEEAWDGLGMEPVRHRGLVYRRCDDSDAS